MGRTQRFFRFRTLENLHKSRLFRVERSTKRFRFRVGSEEVGRLSLFDEEQKVYFACTGNITYTKMGLELYQSLKAVYPSYSGLHALLKAYIYLQENR